MNAGVFISSEKNYPYNLQDLLLGEKNCAIKYQLKVPNIYPKIITLPPKPWNYCIMLSVVCVNSDHEIRGMGMFS